MKIYDVASFPNPFRVRFALAEKNAMDSVEFISVDVMGGEHRTPAFLEKNPLAAVPVLELDDGTCISESPAITEFIDHHFDGPSLTGTSAKSRAVISMMQRRAETMVMDASATYFHHATPGLGPDLETDQNKEWGLRQQALAIKGMGYFDQVLSNSEFIAGDEFSVADITLFAGLKLAEFAGIAVPEHCSGLKSWRTRIASRPSLASL